MKNSSVINPFNELEGQDMSVAEMTDTSQFLTFSLGEDIFAIDDHPVFFAEIFLKFGNCLIETFVHFLGGIEHRGVREFESHASSCKYS